MKWEGTGGLRLMGGKSFNLDFSAAGTDKEDERGRTVDLHALLHTFGSQLSDEGVAPRPARPREPCATPPSTSP